MHDELDLLEIKISEKKLELNELQKKYRRMTGMDYHGIRIVNNQHTRGQHEHIETQ